MRENELILERYRVLEKLGDGGFASVYRAFDERIARRVAIKVLPLYDGSAKAGSKKAERRINETALAGLEEARVAAMLSHPNIVSLFDFEVDEEAAVAYLIMEDIDGVTLDDIPSGDLSDEVIAAVLKAVADALIFAHKNGVLHLDVKPSNILISHEGQIKLADFGLAQLSRARGQHGRATAGTVGYMPLEQLAGEQVSEATDQWALAAVIYELLSDEYPYYEEVSRSKISISKMLKAQEADEVALLDLEDVVLEGTLARALARNPEARFSSVKEFLDVLLPELGDRPAATAGKRELKKIIPELTNDEPEMDALRLETPPAGSRKKQMRDVRADLGGEGESSFDGWGCFGTGVGASLKIITALALAVCLIAWVAPGLLLLDGNNQWFAVQVGAGVFIIGATIGLLMAARRASERRRR